MNVSRLVWREIVHRKLNFGLGLVAVMAATALVVGGLTVLSGYGRRTERLVQERRHIVEQSNLKLTDAMRKITKRMGFNVVIKPRGQNLDDPFADDYAAKFMPEEYADRLASSQIVTVNHLLPTLEQQVEWPERKNRTIFLIGVKGQVPLAHRDPRKPIMPPVPEKGIVIGSFLASAEKLEAGQKVTLLGQELEVVQVYPRRGDKRDRTAWIHLDLMQKLFNKEGLINAIWALECSCALADVGKVRKELQAILPDVEIEEQGEKALARAEARKKAVEVAEGHLKAEEESSGRLMQLGSRFRLILVPLIVISSGIWLGLLAAGNVRERRQEIGLFRAIGVGSAQVVKILVARAVATGLLGALPGYAAGVALGSFAFSLSSQQPGTETSGWLFQASLLAWVLALAPILSAIACWLPVMAATQQDPSVVLRDE